MRGIKIMPEPFNAMRSIMRLGPPMRAPLRLEPELAWIGAPFRVAPPPAVDRNNSSVTGANSAATTGRPSTTRATDTDQSSRPAMKARVPSIGSTTQTRRAANLVGSFSLSSDNQPSPASTRCLCNSSLAAMSASVTGESPCPLVHCLSGPPKNFFATAPASCTAMASRSRSRRSSDAGNGQSLEAQGRRVGAVAELQIVGRRHGAEDVEQMACDRHLAHRVGALALLDPEARGAAAVIAGHHVGARTDQVGHVEPLVDIFDQLFRAQLARFEM